MLQHMGFLTSRQLEKRDIGNTDSRFMSPTLAMPHNFPPGIVKQKWHVCNVEHDSVSVVIINPQVVVVGKKSPQFAAAEYW